MVDINTLATKPYECQNGQVKNFSEVLFIFTITNEIKLELYRNK